MARPSEAVAALRASMLKYMEYRYPMPFRYAVATGDDPLALVEVWREQEKISRADESTLIYPTQRYLRTARGFRDAIGVRLREIPGTRLEQVQPAPARIAIESCMEGADVKRVVDDLLQG